MIVAGRVLQGVAAGVIQPLVMVVAFQVYPAERRGYAMAMYSMGVFLAVAVGPIVGGLVIEWFDWRYIFWAPLPIIGAASLLALVFVPSVRSSEKAPFDWTGYIFLVICVYCLITALTDGAREGWTSSYILGLFTAGIASGVVLIFTQLRDRPTLIDVSLFENKQFAMTALIAFVFGVGNFGTGYGVPVFVQLIQGMTPLDAALLMLPSALLVVAALPFTGRLADTVPPHIGIMIGLTLFAVGTAPMSGANVNTPFVLVMAFFIVSRFGMSFTSPFIMNTALRSLPTEKLTAGGGTINFSRQFGGSLGLTAWVAFVQGRTQTHAEMLSATQNASNAVTQEVLDRVGDTFITAGLPTELHEAGALHYLGQMIQAQASTFGFQDGFLLLAFFFLCALVPAYLLGRIRDFRPS